MDTSTNNQPNMAIFCTQCGSKLATGAKFCGVCGHPVAIAVGETGLRLPDSRVGGLTTQGASEPSAEVARRSVPTVRSAPQAAPTSQSHILDVGNVIIDSPNDGASSVMDDQTQGDALIDGSEAWMHYEKGLLAQEKAARAWDSIRKNFLGGLVYSCVLGILYYLMTNGQGGPTGQGALPTALFIGLALAGPSAVYLAVLKRLPFLVVGVGCFGSLMSIFFYVLAPLFILTGALYVDSMIGFPLLTLALIGIPYAYIIYAVSRSFSARHHASEVSRILD